MMKASRILIVLLLVLAAAGMVQCGSSPEPTATPVPPTATVQPTATAVPTDTPEPTETPTTEPTATLEPTPTVEPTSMPTAEPTATEEPTAAPTAEATAEATSEAEEEESEEGEASEGIEPLQAPIIGHELDGRDACLTCHAVETGLEPAPESHATFVDEDCLTCHRTEEGETAEAVTPGKMTNEQCLTCHGPYDDLIAATLDYEPFEGMPNTPHAYVPHEEPGIPENIPYCLNCHDPHAIPMTEATGGVDPGVRWCYGACHHTGTLNACSDCH